MSLCFFPFFAIPFVGIFHFTMKYSHLFIQHSSNEETYVKYFEGGGSISHLYTMYHILIWILHTGKQLKKTKNKEHALFTSSTNSTGIM